MLASTLRSLWLHRRRFASTCLSVVLGVGFMAGTLVLTTTIDRVFDGLFPTATSSTDVVVRGPALYTTNQGRVQYDLLSDDVLDRVADVPGVDGVYGRSNVSEINVIGADGEVVEGRGAGYVRSWAPDDEFNLSEVVVGEPPTATGELVMDQEVADREGFTVGDTLRVVVPGGEQATRLVGLTQPSTRDTSQGGPASLGATLAQVQAYAGEQGLLEAVDVRAEDGVSAEELVERIQAAEVSPDADVVTLAEAEAELADRFRTEFLFFTQVLLAFSAIALLVGAFIIANTFGILLTQRTRELALMRAIGASRAQLLGSVLLEAAVIGVVAALLGFVAGIGLAFAALRGLRAFGFRMPDIGLVVTPSTAAYAIIVGLLVTTVAAVLPAIRATRIPPVAALRDLSIDHSDHSRIRVAAGLVLLAVGLVLAAPAYGDDVAIDALKPIGSGVVMVVLAVLVLGPVLARPLARVIGAPFARFRGITGHLARQNAMRSPRRTASTAAALTIGVSLVGFITVFASSAQASVAVTIAGGFDGDFIIQPADARGLGGANRTLARDVGALDGVEAVTALSVVTGQFTLPDGGTVATGLAGFDPTTYGDLFVVDLVDGSIDDMGDDQMVVDRVVADQQGITVGSTVDFVSLKTVKGSFEVVAISEEDTLLPDWTVTTAALDRLSGLPADQLVAVKVADDQSPDEVRVQIEALTDSYPAMTVQDRDEYAGAVGEQIDSLLNMIYGLLTISIVIALVGIANTLSLSIHERTRELGLVRAVGMSRRQLRSLVRWEAVIVAVIGTTTGLLVGLAASHALVHALATQGLNTFDVPVVALAWLMAAGAALGVIAALWPARQASKLDVLASIAET